MFSDLHKISFASKASTLFYPYLFALFPIIFLYNHNIHQIQFHFILFPSLIVLILTFILIILFKKVFKNAHKAGLFYITLLVIFHLYENIWDVLANWDFIQKFGINKITMIISIIIFISSFFIIKNTRKVLDNITRSLNIISFILISFNTLNIILYSIQTGSLLDDLKIESKNNNNKTNISSTKGIDYGLRNIFHIILDGYPSSEVLKEFYDFDNQEFIDYLSNKGFYVAKRSTTNYPSATFLSLASTLNFEYVNYIKESVGLNATHRDRDIPYYMIDNNKIIDFLRSRGYKYIHFSSSWGATDYNENSDIQLTGPYDLIINQFSNEFSLVLLQSTMLREINSILNYSGIGRREKILFTLDQLSKLHRIEGPKYIFAHIFSPHPPFLFDANGNMPSEIKMNLYGNIWAQKDSFINQLVYVNKRIMGIVDSILSNSEIPPIILIHGDHGSGSSWSLEPKDKKYFSIKEITDKMLRERLNILNAYYFPDGGEKVLYDDITLVNSFRLLFNYYFDSNYKILEDKNYHSNWFTNPYDLNDVSDRGKY